MEPGQDPRPVAFSDCFTKTLVLVRRASHAAVEHEVDVVDAEECPQGFGHGAGGSRVRRGVLRECGIRSRPRRVRRPARLGAASDLVGSDC